MNFLSHAPSLNNGDSLTELTLKDKQRYDRQIIMKDWGEETQEKIKDTTALIAGVGGLGSPVSVYLAAAGIGEIRLVDNDTVELSNLNRQVLYKEKQVGKSKVKSAKKSLQELNTDIEITALNKEINKKTIDTLSKDADLIIDCMDNYKTRYVLNKASQKREIPLFHAAVEGMQGQATTIIPNETPCIKCIFPNSPPSEKFPVVGATPGLLGTIQVHEVLKYVTGQGDLLTNQLLLVRNGTEFEKIEVQKDPDCEVCQ